MNDKPHVTLIDAHAERHGGNDDVDLVIDESILMLPANVGVQSGVVRQRAVSQSIQRRTGILDVTAADAVDDAGTTLMLLKNFAYLAECLMTAFDSVDEIRAIE